MITGPGSPSVLASMITVIEQHVDWIVDAIAYLDDQSVDVIEPTPEAEDAWVDHVNAVADATLFRLANSWYMGDNIPASRGCFCPMPEAWVRTVPSVTKLPPTGTRASPCATSQVRSRAVRSSFNAVVGGGGPAEAEHEEPCRIGSSEYCSCMGVARRYVILDGAIRRGAT